MNLPNPSLAELERCLVAYILAAFPFDMPAPRSETLAPNAWDALIERARYQGLTSLLFTALETQNFADVPPAAVETLQEQHRRSVLATASVYHELALLLELFHHSNIPLVVLKGAALAKWLYPNSALRPFSDLDLLLRSHDVARVTEILLAQNYVGGNELAEGFRDSYYSEMAFTHTIPPRIGVDAHWNLFVPLYYRRAMDLEWFWQRTESFAFQNQTALVFNPTAQLLHLAVHASLNHQHSPRLIWLYDIALLLYHKSAEIDFAAAAAYAQSSRLAYSVFSVLEQTQRAWHFTLAPEIFEMFRPHHFTIQERIAFALTAAPHNEARVLNDALSMPRPADQARYALRHLFPDANYMRKRYAIRSDLLLPLYYARRLMVTTQKFFRSLWSAITR